MKEFWKELTMALYWGFSYLDISLEFTTAIVILMFSDTIMGMVKAVKFKRRITIKRLFSGLMTKTSILILPFLLALVAKNIAPVYDFTGLINGILDIMIVSEFISILSSVISIKTGKEVKNFDLITTVLKTLRKFLMKIANVILLKTDNNEK